MAHLDSADRRSELSRGRVVGGGLGVAICCCCSDGVEDDGGTVKMEAKIELGCVVVAVEGATADAAAWAALGVGTTSSVSNAVLAAAKSSTRTVLQPSFLSKAG